MPIQQVIDTTVTTNNTINLRVVDQSVYQVEEAQPNEVRSWYGTPPAGWETVSDTNSLEPALWQPAPAFIEFGDPYGAATLTSTTASAHKGLVHVGSSKILSYGTPDTASNSKFSIIDLSNGKIEYFGVLSPRNRPNIRATTLDRKALIQGGNDGQSKTIVIDEFGVVTRYADSPNTTGTNFTQGIFGAGGRISNTKFGVFTCQSSGGASLETLIFDISTNTWTKGAACPSAHLTGAIAVFGDDVLVFGNSSAASAGVIHKYSISGDSYSVSSLTYPGGVVGIMNVSSCQLADGNWLLHATYHTVDGVNWVVGNKMFVVTPSAIIAGPVAPGSFSTDFRSCSVADNGLNTPYAPVYFIKHERAATLGMEQAFLYNESNQHFLSNKTVKFARKL